jgi:hypothetical protein
VNLYRSGIQHSHTTSPHSCHSYCTPHVEAHYSLSLLTVERIHERCKTTCEKFQVYPFRNSSCTRCRPTRLKMICTPPIHHLYGILSCFPSHPTKFFPVLRPSLTLKFVICFPPYPFKVLEFLRYSKMKMALCSQRDPQIYSASVLCGQLRAPNPNPNRAAPAAPVRLSTRSFSVTSRARDPASFFRSVNIHTFQRAPYYPPSPLPPTQWVTRTVC